MCTLILKFELGGVWCAPLVPALGGRCRQISESSIKASMVSIVSFRKAKAVQREPASKINKQINKWKNLKPYYFYLSKYIYCSQTFTTLQPTLYIKTSTDIWIIIENFVLIEVQFQNSVIVVQLFMFISEILKALILSASQGHPTLTPSAALASLKVLSQ